MLAAIAAAGVARVTVAVVTVAICEPSEIYFWPNCNAIAELVYFLEINAAGQAKYLFLHMFGWNLSMKCDRDKCRYQMFDRPEREKQ